MTRLQFITNMFRVLFLMMIPRVYWEMQPKAKGFIRERSVRLVVQGGYEIPIKWEWLRPGDKIRVYESDGIPDGHGVVLVRSHPYEINGTTGIEAQIYPKV